MQETWFEVLVIIISVLMIVILLFVAMIGYRIYKLMKTVKTITDQAQGIMDRADHVASFFEKTAGPVAIVKLVSNITEALNRKGGKKR